MNKLSANPFLKMALPFAQQLSKAPITQSGLELGLNKIIENTPSAQFALLPLSGASIQLQLFESSDQLNNPPILNYTLFFSDQIDILEGQTGGADLSIATTFEFIEQIKNKNIEQLPLTDYIQQDILILDGQVKLAQPFLSFVHACKPDMAVILSKYIGDLPAYHASQGAKFIARHVTQSISKNIKYAQDFFEHELNAKR